MKYFSQSAVSKRVFSVLLLTGLAVGIAPLAYALPDPAASSPSPIEASESQSAAAQVPAQQAPEAKKTQEEQANIFRLEGPIVKWTAKSTGMSPESTATLFEFINFGLIAVLVGVPLVRTLPKVIRKRSQSLQHNIESARTATEDAKMRLSAIEAKFAGLDAEIASIRAQVEQESQHDENRIKASLVEENARIVASAEQEIAVAAAHARRELQNFAADLAIDQAIKKLVLTPEADQAMIAEFVRGVTKEGQN